ncbi:MAG: type 2 lantipeptide synthetase LanM [Verrucomicrobia bacterium]|nr:type 2 lantipeptide synthetase LanM [Verrucomicrobiota bacterium]
MLPSELLARARYLHERLRDLSKSVIAPGASDAPTESASHLSSEALAKGEARQRSTDPDRSPALEADLSRRSEAEADFLFWKKQLSGTGYDRFAERLRSLGISEQDAVFLSQESSFREQPGSSAAMGLDRDKNWDEIFGRALEQPTLHLEGGDAFPFVQLWLPLVSHARESVQPLAADTSLFAPTALDGLLLTLLHDLSDFAAFPTFRIFSESRLGDESLNEFTRRVMESGYLVLFERFPVLARQLSRLVATWIDATSSFLHRFQEGISEIRKLARSERGLLARAKSGISDRHDGGRQVILLTFDDDAKILYKPKNVSVSEVLISIDEWLRAFGFTPGWRIARVIARDGYGWEEYIEQSPCSSAEEVRSYYRSGGELLCLAYLLNAFDLWRDNLIAAGNRPVPIDTECFFHPGRGGAEASAQDRHTSEASKASVLETGLLPLWQLSASHLPADFSGLGTGIVDLSELKITEWENVNSDDMRPVTKPKVIPPPSNTVRWQDQAQDLRRFRAELIEGFCALYRTILYQKAGFVRLVEKFGDAKTRFLYRPTQVYGSLLKNAHSPQNLTSGFRQSVVFEALYRVPLRESALTPTTKQFIDFEVESLLGLDIPRFHVRLDSRDLYSMDFCEPDILRQKPLDTVRARVSAMGPEDLKFQLEVIEESLNRFPTPIERPLSREQATSIIIEWAQEIQRRILPEPSDYLWAIPSYLPQDLGIAERQGIYLGDMGVLIFLAAAEKILGFACVPEITRVSGRLAEFGLPSGYPLGICNGLGALIYGSLLLGSLTEKKAWTELALSLNARNGSLSETSSLDITSGVAGLLLATTRLYQATQDGQARASAQAAARLLADRFDPNSGWRQPDGNFYLGFAHGLAGIVFALDQYGRAVGDQQYLPLIQQALALESGRFADHSWPNMLHGPRRTFKNWCHGTAGILMSRAATGALEPEKFAPNEVSHLLEKVSQRGQADHWCCGNFGIAEALTYIGQQANLLEAQKKSAVLLEDSLERGRQAGFFRLQSSIGENFCFSPSLFRGTSGLGYSLLRFAYPGKLPCILAFEV